MASQNPIDFSFAAFDFSSIVDKIYYYLGIFLLLAVVGGVVFAFIYIKRRNKDVEGKSKVGWWHEVGARMEPGKMDVVDERVIPGTTLRIFYNDKKDLWIPRFTRGITANLYYVLITPTHQMVNFTIPSLSSDLKRANLEYDHTDMLWAAENSREYIKRNYKDKSVKWWQLYQNTIATAILIFVMTFSMIMIIYFLRGLVVDMRGVAGALGDAALKACQNAQTSGVVGA